jgi:hypothetical protein
MLHKLTFLLLILSALPAFAGETANPNLQIRWRVYEGDPAGDEVEGTKQAIANGVLVSKDGQPLADRNPGGISVEMAVRSTTYTHVTGELRVDVSSGAETDGDDFVADRGETYRLAGKFTVDKPVRIWLKREKEDVPRWAEVTVLSTGPQRVSNRNAGSISNPYFWLPAWQSPTSMRR